MTSPVSFMRAVLFNPVSLFVIVASRLVLRLHPLSVLVKVASRQPLPLLMRIVVPRLSDVVLVQIKLRSLLNPRSIDVVISNLLLVLLLLLLKLWLLRPLVLMIPVLIGQIRDLGLEASA
jgi:hypothetical protein